MLESRELPRDGDDHFAVPYGTVTPPGSSTFTIRNPAAINHDYKLVRVAGRIVAVGRLRSDDAGIAFSFGPGSLEPSPTIPLPNELATLRQLTVTAAGDRASVVWLDTPDPSSTTFALRRLDLDGSGNVTAPPRELARENGVGSHLRVASDDDGIAVTYSFRSFEPKPAQLVLRRFDSEGHAVGAPREITGGLPLPPAFDSALAPTGAGAWFVTYVRPTVETSTALFGRFVTGAAAPGASAR